MPIYEYQCDDCGATVEAFQKMSDDPLDTCEVCGGHLRKVLHPVAIHFKGSGFYTTDYGRGSGRRPAVRESGDGGDAGTGGSAVGGSASKDTGDASSKAAKDGGPRERQKTT